MSLTRYVQRHRMGLKRSFYTALGITAGGALSLYVQREWEAKPEDERAGPPPALLRIKDYMERTAGRATAATNSAAIIARTITRAVVASQKPGAVSLGASVADAVAALSTDEEKETLVIAGGALLLDGLLAAAAGRSRGEERDAAERALLNLLATGSTASAIFSRPGALPQLMEALTRHSAEPGALAEAISCATHMARMPHAALLDDIAPLLSLMGESDVGLVRARLLAVQLLAALAEASVTNAGKLTAMDVGPALAAAAAGAASLPTRDRELQWEITRLMAVLARDSPLRKRLRTAAWLEQLLYIAADASATADWILASRALDAFSVCLSDGDGGGEEVAAALRRTNVAPLLFQLWEQPDQLLRRSVASTVAAMSAPDGGNMEESEREDWTERFLALLCSEGDSDVLRHAASTALAALASAPGSAGLHVAHAWLGELLIYLSRAVKPYEAVQMTPLPGEDPAQAYHDAVNVVPTRARAIAAQLRETSDRAGSYQEPPADMESMMSPAALAAYPSAAAAVDAAVADNLLRQALAVLCTLVSADEKKQAWLQTAGALQLLERLILLPPVLDLEGPLPAQEAATAPGPGPDDGMSLPVRKQAARLLALLAAGTAAEDQRMERRWMPFMKAALASDDCKLSSHAARALLNLMSVRAARHSSQHDRIAAAAGAAGAGESGAGGSGLAAPVTGSKMLETEQGLGTRAETLMEMVKSEIDRVRAEHLGAGREARPLAGRRLVLRDGVHLFSPRAPHHRVLAKEGAASHSPGAPLVDVVFVHGIRGGAFATWRASGGQYGAASRNLRHGVCWPSAWLAEDVPGARLLTVEYAAPVSAWEGSSLPLMATVGQLMDRLIAAGVGERPVIFVCHSLGGLLVKEMLAASLQEGATSQHVQLAAAARGLVTYATPHFGTWLADVGWNLRYIGASPAAAVLHLKPGQHLEEVNRLLRERHLQGALPALSFAEGVPTHVQRLLPKVVVVPPESAYPGFGDFVMLSDMDHIAVCKPPTPDHPAYARLMEFLRQRVADGEASAPSEAEAERCGSQPILS